MNLSIGIVGLPNVGKSTLFNALLKRQQALVANYPFATIEPNVGVVPVPDYRLEVLADIVARDSIAPPGTGQYLAPLQNDNSNRPPIKPATVNFVDIAGLVKGASEGAGLGNKFLSHIREVSVVAHVVRAFEDPNIIREGSIGVREDWETVNTELLLADLESLKNQEGRLKNNDPHKTLLQKIIADLDNGVPVRDMQFTDVDRKAVRELFLLTSKPEIIVLNVSESEYNPSSIEAITEKYSELLFGIKVKGPNVILRNAKDLKDSSATPQNDKADKLQNDNIIVISAKIEAELASLSDDEQKEYLTDLGLSASGLERLIQKAYEELGLISFLTAGEKEVRAWTIAQGSNAVIAAGEIHTDFMKKFIKAEVVHFDDFVEFGGWKISREHGKALLEGRDYVVQDGDVIEFKIGS